MNRLASIDSKNGRQLHKFGGSSLADVNCYQRVANIMAAYSQPGDLIVVSAAGNTTNQLINWLTLSRKCHISAYQVLQNLSRYQIELINGLLSPKATQKLLSEFIDDLERLALLLNGPITDAVYAEVVGHGEIWSARLMAALLSHLDIEAAWLDARDFLRAERTVQPKVDEIRSRPLLRKLLTQHHSRRLVVTGFICRNLAGETVLLGRNGSDYSATQIGALASVASVTIWSDVAGIYSADPHKVKDACLLPLLRLDEAIELARLSVPMLHTRTLQPLANSNIDLFLRCSYQPELGSTRIERVLAFGAGVKIITSHDDVYLIELLISPKLNFKLVYKEMKVTLEHAQIKPLAVGIHHNRRLLQLCYTSEVVSSALYILEQSDLSVHLQLREGMTLIALVGAGIAKNPLYSHYFYQQFKYQPIEFFWKGEDSISLIAVLRIGYTEHFIQGLHSALFRSEQHIDLLFSKNNVNSRYFNFSL